MANLAEEIALRHGHRWSSRDTNYETVANPHVVAALNDMLDHCIAECQTQLCDAKNAYALGKNFGVTNCINALTALKG